MSENGHKKLTSQPHPSSMCYYKPPYLLWKRRQRWARPFVGLGPHTSPGTHPLPALAPPSCLACLLDRRQASSLCHEGLSQTPSGYPWVKTSVKTRKILKKKKLVCVLHCSPIHNGKSQLLGSFNLSLQYVFTGQVWIFTNFWIDLII